ncbi:hypothetical protein C2S53_010382 [Perilla frutescens var. hirtella]|uniref:Uncharacterized protein n=1 Tax=Perilla frutescens var. hirtella TaxID=608512 RepID=A0AAD4J0U8_PERFH|nr:hypothetical protein C2S53_010382 [Perilla frutescens var. hirtella]
MARGKSIIEKKKKKLENPASRQTAFSKRRASLFKKAMELSVLCKAEVAVIVISAEGIIHEYASSSIQDIITRFRNCKKSGTRAPESNPEEPKERVLKEEEAVPRQNTEKHNLRKVLGKDLACMNLHELFMLEEKLNKGLLCIKDRKMQMLEEELEQSRIQEQQVLQRNQILLKQVEEYQAFVRPVYYPVPLSFNCSEMECDDGPADREYRPLTSFAAPPAITDGTETERSFQQSYLPSTKFVSPLGIDYGVFLRPADRDSLPSTSSAAHNRLNPSQQRNTVKPLFHWFPHGVSAEMSAPPSGASSSNSHSQVGCR